MNGGRKFAAKLSRGFTLIELMVVIVILGSLVALVGPSVWNALVGSTRKTVEMQITMFRDAIDMYMLEYRTLPQSLQDLTQPSKQSGEPFLRETRVPLDPWGQDYQYQPAAKRQYVISSNGDDKLAGTADDIIYSTSEGGFK